MVTRLLFLLVFFGFGLHADAGDKEITKKELLALLPDDKFLGNEKAPIIMIEYASLTCYHCSLFHKEVLPQIKRKYIDTGKLLYVFRHFPMDYRALKSSMLSYCYKKQEEYFNFNKAVFNSIDSWNHSNPSDLSLLSKIAALSNLKQDKFNQCIDSQEIMDKIVNNKLLAINKLGITGSPAFFIKPNNNEFNGDYKHEGYRKADYFVDIIEKFINSNSN